MRIPRKLKKQIVKSQIIYDMKSCPNSLSMDDVVHCFVTMGWLLWDSYNEGEKPMIVKGNAKLKVINVHKKEEVEKLINNNKLN